MKRSPSGSTTVAPWPKMAPAAAALLKTGAQVLHIAGGRDEAEVRTEAGGREGYHVLGFCDRMADAYSVADLVLSRAGASSLTELAHAGLPSILVPYPYAADDHQTKNGEVFADDKPAIALTASNLSEVYGVPIQRFDVDGRTLFAVEST